MGTPITLFGLALLYGFFVACIFLFDFMANKDKLSAVKLVSYFAAVEVFVMLWFAVRPEAVESYIFSVIAKQFSDYHFVIQAYTMSLIIYVFVIIGVVSASYSRRAIVGGIFLRNLTALRSYSTIPKSLIVYAIGIAVYIVFLWEIGGLKNLWENIGFRTTKTAGLGYLQAAYSFLINFGSALLYVEFYKRRRFLWLSFFVLISIFVLGSLGQRSPVVLLVFTLLLVHHYCVRPFGRILSVRIVVSALLSILFMFSFVQLRPGASDVSIAVGFEKHVIQRLGVIERQVVAGGYFKNHEYWGWGLYKSLLYGAIPRTLYPEKPPLDTGVYLHYIKDGAEIYPPVPARDLHPTSWPDGFLAGYVSFGFAGLALLSFISGAFCGAIYNQIRRSSYSVATIVLYASIGFMGVTPWSPFGIVQIFVVLLPFMILGLLSRLRWPYFRRRDLSVCKSA